jgi:hypothetical protein
MSEPKETERALETENHTSRQQENKPSTEGVLRVRAASVSMPPVKLPFAPSCEPGLQI